VGQQQLLLIVLGIIVVGVAIVVGINLFRTNAVETKRSTIVNECINLASMAQQYYRKPVAMGGGASAFDGSRGGIAWSIPSTLQHTASGDYQITSIAPGQIVIQANGNEVVNGVDQVQVTITILPDSYQVVND